MAKYVKCKYCGKTFKKKEYNYQDGNRYVCVNCAIQHNDKVKKAKKYERLVRTGMKQSYLSMIIKLFLGIAFIMEEMQSPMSEDMIIMCIIGVLLILSAIIPFLRRKKVKAKYNSK